MSLLLDALKQAEENKKQVPEQEPIKEVDELALDNISAKEPTAPKEYSLEVEETSPAVEPASAQEASLVKKAKSEESTSSLQKEMSAEIDIRKKPASTPERATTEETIKPEIETTITPQTTAPQPQHKPATLDPALNVFAAGSKKPSKRNKSSRLWLLIALLAFVILGLLATYFWFSQQQSTPTYADDDLYFEEEILDEVPDMQTPPAQPAIKAPKQESIEPAVQSTPTETPSASGAEINTLSLNSSSSVEPVRDNPQIQITRSQPIEIKKRTLTQQQSESLNRAYKALLAGDHSQAKKIYNQVLVESPKQIDALLGLAKINSHENKTQSARELYEKVLRINDSNTVAQLGLLHTYQEETSFKKVSVLQELANKYPESSQIAVSLGHELANQSKWSQAQQAYFKAFSLSPENAVYAFNLAVSLDRMEKYSAAKQYYRKALLLSETTPSALNTNSVTQRLLQLGE